MPRLTDQHYLTRAHQLHQFWDQAQDVFGYLSPAEQWQLHEYFQLSKLLSDSDLLVHRAVITAQRPTLPQQAGRALRKLDAAAGAWALQQQRRLVSSLPPQRHQPTDQQRVRAYGIVKPEIDLQAFVQLLMDMANDPQGPPEPGHVEDRLTDRESSNDAA